MQIDSLIANITRLNSTLEDKITVYQRNHNALIDGLVKMQQEARLGKDYKTSDALRNILGSAGVIILQGTAGFEYTDIPEYLRGRPIIDTWMEK